MRTLAALLLAAVLTLAAPAAEPWLKKDDIVALVGGEDMVALAEEGWLETLVTWAQPGGRIRFRSLAWEGDTVFEQRRDLNYPTLETQLDRMGATVVLCQFGKMESFAGKEGVAAFTEAYEKLLARLSGEKKRRIGLMMPTPFGHPPSDSVPIEKRGYYYWPRNVSEVDYEIPLRHMLAKKNYDIRFVVDENLTFIETVEPGFTRDGVHLKPAAQLPHALGLVVFLGLAPQIYAGLRVADTPVPPWRPAPGQRELPPAADIPKLLGPLNAAIAAKNRLWFHYTRPQNWAFLAGNRTNQPSSRDHLDPTKRWFPEEMEQWVPLIEAKEKEIWKLAAAPR